MDTPKPGDKIYVNTSLYISHGEDDFRGGIATVTRVEMGISAGKSTPFVSIVERPGTSYNWEILAEKQEELKKEFGETLARPDPDYHDYGER